MALLASPKIRFHFISCLFKGAVSDFVERLFIVDLVDFFDCTGRGSNTQPRVWEADHASWPLCKSMKI